MDGTAREVYEAYQSTDLLRRATKLHATTRGQIKAIWQLSDVLEELHRRDEYLREAISMLDGVGNPDITQEDLDRLRGLLDNAEGISGKASRSAMRVSGVMMGFSAEVFALSDVLAEEVKHKEQRVDVHEREGEDVDEEQ